MKIYYDKQEISRILKSFDEQKCKELTLYARNIRMTVKDMSFYESSKDTFEFRSSSASTNYFSVSELRSMQVNDNENIIQLEFEETKMLVVF